jgi:hypothetical protein
MLDSSVVHNVHLKIMILNIIADEIVVFLHTLWQKHNAEISVNYIITVHLLK